MHQAVDDLQILFDLSRSIVLVNVGRVRFEEVVYAHG